MAAGDITYDLAGPRVVGNHYQVTGSLEADTSKRAFQVVNGTIIGVSLVDETDVQYHQCVLNSDDGTEGSDNGSLYVDSSGTATLRFVVSYI